MFAERLLKDDKALFREESAEIKKVVFCRVRIGSAAIWKNDLGSDVLS